MRMRRRLRMNARVVRAGGVNVGSGFVVVGVAEAIFMADAVGAGLTVAGAGVIIIILASLTR